MSYISNIFNSAYGVYALVGIAIVVTILVLRWVWLKELRKAQIKQEVLMLMPEGRMLRMELPIDYSSAYSSFWMEVNHVRRSWIMLPKLRRTIKGTKRSKFICDWRSLLPYNIGGSQEERKTDLTWVKGMLGQIAGVQHDVTVLKAPKLEVQERFRDRLITIALTGVLGIIVMVVLFILIKRM